MANPWGQYASRRSMGVYEYVGEQTRLAQQISRATGMGEDVALSRAENIHRRMGLTTPGLLAIMRRALAEGFEVIEREVEQAREGL